MHSGFRARQLTQGTLSAVLVLGLLLGAWYSSSENRAGGDDSSEGQRARAQSRSSIDEDEASEQRSLKILSMPAYVDLEQSLTRLDDARNTLLKQAAAGSTEANQAVREYQQAVQTVQAGLERLRSRLTPDEYDHFWASLESDREERLESELPLPESRLGILPDQE
jgi:hypothetical protein